MDAIQTPVQVAFSKAVESALNTAIRLDEMEGRAFKALEDKVIAVTLTPMTTPLFFVFTDQQVSIQHQLMGDADSAITANLADFISLPLSQTLPYQFTSGNEQLANTFVGALSQLEVDWEEQLSHYTGDLVAFKIGHGIRSLLAKKSSAKQTAGETIQEYLQFEIELLPTQSQINRFVKGVNETQQQIDKLAERIARLQNGSNHASNTP